MNRLNLNGQWSMTRCKTSDTYPVQIPGSVLSALIDAKAIDDPYYGRNEYPTRELFREDYSFFREFEVSQEQLAQEKTDLVCEGLDTLAEIYLNGVKIAETNNMHRIWRISAKEYLNVGTNQLQIIFRSTLNYIENYKYDEDKEIHVIASGAMKGNQLIRKAHSMFGWDWGPQLPDAGIFRDIYLESFSGSRISDIRIHQKHENGTVLLQVETEVSNVDKESKPTVRLILTDEDKQKIVTTSTELLIFEPKLWWPNGYGEQPLYELCVQLLNEDGSVREEQKKTIGLRTLTVCREADEWGRKFTFTVNGQKIFTKGGNYIPEDCVYSRITRERQEFLLESCRRAHYNCVRVWGGGYYPSDEFYDICDKKGFIVWQDLMYACNVYDVTEEFAENCRQEAIDNVKRLRHHASLGLWCGNNEIESAWHQWGNYQAESPQLRADYIKLFEYILPKAVKETDPDTFYWHSSPSSGGCFQDPDNENNGDTHYWAVWHGQKPFTDYKEHYFRFCSEFGFQSFPCSKTIDTFAEKTEQNIFSPVLESHQKNDAANGKILYYLSENFRYPKDFEQLLYVSQLLQGIAIKYGVEHWRRNRGRCMGALYWQVNDNWPVASWSSIDYFGRWKALHYMACKFYAPIAVSLTTEDGKIQLFVENETNEMQSCQANIQIKNVQCEVLREGTATESVEPFSSKKVLELDLAEIPEYAACADKEFLREDWERQIVLEGTVTLQDGNALKTVETLAPYKYMELPVPKLSVEVRQQEEDYEISLTSDCFAPFVALDFPDADVIFSDNFFTIADRKTHVIKIRKQDIQRGSFSSAEDMKKRLQIKTLADSYK